MVGRAVPTMVWSRAARNIPSMRPLKTSRIWRWVRADPRLRRRRPEPFPDRAAALGCRCSLRVAPPVVPPGRVPGPALLGLVEAGLESEQTAGQGGAFLFRPVHDGLGQHLAPGLGHRLEDGVPPRSDRLSSEARPSSGSGTLATSPMATRSRICRLTVDRSSSTVPASSDSRSGAWPTAAPAASSRLVHGLPVGQRARGTFSRRMAGPPGSAVAPSSAETLRGDRSAAATVVVLGPVGGFRQSSAPSASLSGCAAS